MAMTSVNIKLPKAAPNLQLQLATSAQLNTADISSLVKQITKGSKSADTLNQLHREFAATEDNITRSFAAFKKLSSIVTQLNYQQHIIDKQLKHCSAVVEQLNAIERQTSDSLKGDH